MSEESPWLSTNRCRLSQESLNTHRYKVLLSLELQGEIRPGRDQSSRIFCCLTKALVDCIKCSRRPPSRLANGGQGRSGKLGSLFKRTWMEDRQCVFVLWFLQLL